MSVVRPVLSSWLSVFAALCVTECAFSVKHSIDINRTFGACVCVLVDLSLPRLFPLSRVQQEAQHKGAACRYCLSLSLLASSGACVFGWWGFRLDTGHGTPHPFHPSLAHPVWGTGHLVMCYYCCCNMLPVIVEKEHEIDSWRLWEGE